jgi:rhamnosyl/mannosyltransferase
VLPSVTKAEAFGMVQLEAMACAKPVISTSLRGSGVPWVNEHGRTGIVVPPADVAALRLALTELAASPERREQLGLSGRARVIERFSVRRFVDQTQHLYAEVAAAAHAGDTERRQASRTDHAANATTLKTP